MSQRVARRFPSSSRWSRLCLMAAGGMLLLSACSNEAGSASDGPRLKSGPIPEAATTSPGYDAAAERATATELIGRLVDAGIGCRGEPAPPRAGEDRVMETGVVVGLDCEVDGITISISVFHSKAAKETGIANLESFSCLMALEHDEYVDGDSWTIGARPTGKNDSDLAVTKVIAEAVDAPIRTRDCD